MNQTLAGLNDQLTSLKAQLAVQTSSGEEGPNPLMYILPAALAGVAAALRHIQEEEGRGVGEKFNSFLIPQTLIGMTVPKTVLAVALLLLLALTVDAASPPQWIREVVVSTGPYEYQWGGYPWLLSWFPPHAVPMNLTFLNVTWWKPHSVWFKGTYYVRCLRVRL
jgi:hypothetical protein